MILYNNLILKIPELKPFFALSFLNTHIIGVFLSLRGAIIPNHGYVMISDIGSTIETALLCNTNYLPDGGVSSGGDWFGPDGTRIGYIGSTDVPGFVRNRAPEVVRLIRYTVAGTPPEGIYSCQVQDDTLTIQNVYVGLYNSGEGGLFSLKSSSHLMHIFQILVFRVHLRTRKYDIHH